MNARLWVVTAAMLASGLLASCGKPAPAPSAAAEPAYDLTNTVHDVMAYVLDPATDIVWAAAGTIVTEEGEQDLSPTTDEGWAAVKNAAAVVAESGNLLLMPGRAVDNAEWADYARGLVDVGVKTMDAADAKDKQAVFDLGGQMYRICTACHQKYIIGE